MGVYVQANSCFSLLFERELAYESRRSLIFNEYE